jgi:hypothetical protein
MVATGYCQLSYRRYIGVVFKKSYVYILMVGNRRPLFPDEIHRVRIRAAIKIYS